MNFKTNLHLENKSVLLRPIQPDDLAQLQPIALDADTWRWYVTRIADTKDLKEWTQAALTDRQDQKRYPFIIIDKATGKVAGSTAFGNISVFDKRLEIGWTWLGKDFRSTGLNRHCKFLLLSYAFEVLQYERIELKTDVLNMRSRKAILKIGATEEGILRSHMLMHDGRRRDTLYYSILRPEWPGIKASVFADLMTTGTQV